MVLFEEFWFQLVFSVVIGYLFGSFSFARIITFIKTKSIHVEHISQPIPGSDEMFESDSVSATVISQNFGKGFGCLTSILDMLKVALPTFAVKLVFPEFPFFLFTALAGMIGHNYTIYHRFQGGRGESPMIGAMIIINWFGIFITNGASFILGFLTGSVLVMRYGWYVLMIFWYWIFFDNIYYVGFMILTNFFFWFSMRKDLAKYGELKQEQGMEIKEADVSDFLLMGKGIGNLIDNYGLPALIRKLLKK